MVKEAMKKTMPTIQSVWPICEPGIASCRAESGGIGGPAAGRGACAHEEGGQDR